VPFLFGGCFILFKDREVILLLGHALYWFSFHLLMLSVSGFLALTRHWQFAKGRFARRVQLVSATH
jgi:hypothetical protein